MVNLRCAEERDIDGVNKIIDLLQVSRQQEDWQRAKSGLFEYPKTREELLLALNPYFIVAETLDGIRGYTLAYNSTFFRKMFADSEHLEYRFVLDKVGGDFLYVDQMGVLNPETLGAGRIAKALIDNAINHGRADGLGKIFTFVCHKPLFNERSANFARRFDFINTREVKIENGIILGSYERQV